MFAGLIEAAVARQDRSARRTDGGHRLDGLTGRPPMESLFSVADEAAALQVVALGDRLRRAWSGTYAATPSTSVTGRRSRAS